MIVAFIGSRKGMTERQKFDLALNLGMVYRRGEMTFIHGGCVGADEEFHKAVMQFKSPNDKVEVYPGYSMKDVSDMRFRGDFTGADVVHDEDPFLERNRLMVRRADIIIVAPRKGGRGTRYTITYTKRLSKALKILEE